MHSQERFIQVFQVPPAMVPYLNLMATDAEMALIAGLGDGPLTQAEVAEMLGLSLEEADLLLKGAIHRDMVDWGTRAGVTTYSAGTFYATMDIWTSYETGTWRRLPQAARDELSDWQLDAWIRLWTPLVEIIKRDPDEYVRMKNRDVLLLDEALELVGAADAICLLPCPCKTTLLPGSPVIEGSMRLGERARVTLERGQGRSLTAAEAQAHLLQLDRMGLIHTGPRAWRENDPKLEWISHGNCNPAYSFPWRAGQKLGLDKQYPRVHYTAEVNWDSCNHCGTCTGRCPFGAFYHTGDVIALHGEQLRQVSFDPEQCYGCGLCANTCPQSAIKMRPL